jgi:hypothetical protein
MHDRADTLAQTAPPQSKAAIVDEPQTATVAGAAAVPDQGNTRVGRLSVPHFNRCDSPARAEARAGANQNMIKSSARHA